ncbi:ISAs1 family transposase [Rapidithrix thailandica]|uniref:ISAs1 family transposase n=1 Tax=Rapidithrix thailandica TaxID=413964 RepID=A0AAW9S6Q2_9BACT
MKILSDPRSEKSQVYPLQTLVFLTIAAVMTGAETFVDIEEFGKHKLTWLKQYVPCPQDRIPSHDTLGDFYSRLAPEAFGRCFLHWIAEVCDMSEGELIALDGKTLRNSHDHTYKKTALHLISAWATRNQLVLRQAKVDGKSNEITAIPTSVNRVGSERCHRQH